MAFERLTIRLIMSGEIPLYLPAASAHMASPPCFGASTVTLGSEEAGPVAVCDTAGPLSNAVDKIAAADEAAKLDLMTCSPKLRTGNVVPEGCRVPLHSKKGHGELKNACRSLAIDMVAERTLTARTVACLLLAPLRHVGTRQRCLFMGVERKSSVYN
jgi:hypothetical protein